MESETCFDLSSDHSPVFVTLCSEIVNKSKNCILYNKKTNWIYFWNTIGTMLKTDIKLKNEEDITRT
jgi:hypothetical protein